MELQTLEPTTIDPVSLHQRMKRILNNTDMSISSVDKAFAEMINIRNIHRKIGIASGTVRTYRYNLLNKIPIGTDTKLALLKKNGWTPDNKSYSKDDLAAFFRYWNRTSQEKRNHGIEHVFEQWELARK